MAELTFKAVKDCTLVSENADGSLTYRGIVVTGKGDSKREEPCEFPVYPTLAIAVACMGDESDVLESLNRQVKTDCYNAVRNGLNAVPTPGGAVRRAMKALQEGRMTAAEAKAIFEQALASIETDSEEESA